MATEERLIRFFTTHPWFVVGVILGSLVGGGGSTVLNMMIPIRAGAHTAEMDRQIMMEHITWEEEHFAPFWETEQRLLSVERDCRERDEEIEAIGKWIDDHTVFKQEAELDWRLKFQRFEDRLEQYEKDAHRHYPGQ